MATDTDWAATGSMLSGIGTIGGALAVLIAAGVARISINQFRSQKITERLIEHAERILTATYKAHYALDHVRGAMLWAGELQTAEKMLREADAITGEKDDRDKRLISAQVYIDRLNRISEDRNLLVEVMPISRALWGKELEEEVQKLHRQFWLVECYATELIDTDDPDRRFALRKRLAGTCAKNDDDISIEVRRITAAIEEKCLPILKADSPDMEAVAAIVRRVGDITLGEFGSAILPMGSFASAIRSILKR